jgi:hypothetical protein
MDPTDPATRSSCPTSAKCFPPTQPGKRRLKIKAGRKNKGKGRREGGASRSSSARLRRPKSDIETQSGEVYCRPSLLCVWCACAGSKGGPVVTR